MPPSRSSLLNILLPSLLLLSLPVAAQVVVGTLPVGDYPTSAALNTVTNTLYVVNTLCSSFVCPNPGSVTVVDGATHAIKGTVNVGIGPGSIAVNSTTNKIYVGNVCGNDPNCQSPGSITVIDGATLATATVVVGYVPSSIAMNPVTNRIYVANECLGPGYPDSCPVCSTGQAGTVTVINGATLATHNVSLGCAANSIDLNPTTNKIYASSNRNIDGSGTGTVTVIDGTTLSTQTVSTGYFTAQVAVDSTANRIYASNVCGDQLCQSGGGTVTVINGSNLQTQSVAAGVSPYFVSVNPVTSNVYVANLCRDQACSSGPALTVIKGSTLATETMPICSAAAGPGPMGVNQVTNKIYLPCSANGGTVASIDGVTNNITPIAVGDEPVGPAVNSVTNTIYVPNSNDATLSVIGGATTLQLSTVTPCRLLDTRQGTPIQGGTSQTFNLPQLAQTQCSGLDLSSAASYSLNVTLLPKNGGRVRYLTIWPNSQLQPTVSTMNSDGRNKANAAIVSAGLSGAVNVFVTDTADVLLDIDGYFRPSGAATLQLYPVTPCRIADTRGVPGDLGGPSLSAGRPRSFPLLEAASCFPQGASPVAYSLNFTALPHVPLGYLTVWPTGETQPNVSTINAPTGANTANAAIVPAGTGEAVSVFASADTDLLIDINGYFAPAGQGGLSLYPTPPCRVLDTRNGNGAFSGLLSPPVDVLQSPCGAPSQSVAYALNATVVPAQAGLGYLTLWADGQVQPGVSTLNAHDGAIASNMAIVPAGTLGKIDAFAGNGMTNLILDISAFFAP
jgi:DNA-binding beta-propeller fold protein YncE